MECDVSYPEFDLALAHVRVFADQVRHEQRLRIDPMVMARQSAEVEPVPLAVEAEFALGLPQRPLQQTRGQAPPFEPANDRLLQDSGAGPPLDHVTSFQLEHRAVDAGGPHDVSDGEPGRPRPDDHDRTTPCFGGFGSIGGDRSPQPVSRFREDDAHRPHASCPVT
jgi:hypothetical protein